MVFFDCNKGREPQISHLQKCQKCSEEHIDEPSESVRILLTEQLGCITGTRFSLKIYAPNCESEDGDNRYILIPAKAVFTAANNQNQLTIFSLEPRVV